MNNKKKGICLFKPLAQIRSVGIQTVPALGISSMFAVVNVNA